jgi:hypothetical protein
VPPGPACSQCRRLALWPWPTGQPPSPSPVRPAAWHGRATPPALAGLGPLPTGRRPGPTLFISLSVLVRSVVPPRRPSPNSAHRFKMVAAATTPPPFPHFLSSSLATRARPTPHLLSTADNQRTPARTGFLPNHAVVHHSSVSASPSLHSPQSAAPCPLELQDLTALIGDHRSYPATIEHRCLAVDPPFWCAFAPSSLPGVLPVAPASPPATPCRRLATTRLAASAPPCRPTRARDVVNARGLAATQRHGPISLLDRATSPRPTRLFSHYVWQAATPSGLWSWAGFEVRHCTTVLNHF